MLGRLNRLSCRRTAAGKAFGVTLELVPSEIMGSNTLPPGEPLDLSPLVTPTAQGIASRILAKTAGGSVTLFAFGAGEALTEHTSPFEALAFVLEGVCRFTVGGVEARAPTGTVVRLLAHIPHALEAVEATRLLLVMLRETA